MGRKWTGPKNRPGRFSVEKRLTGKGGKGRKLGQWLLKRFKRAPINKPKGFQPGLFPRESNALWERGWNKLNKCGRLGSRQVRNAFVIWQNIEEELGNSIGGAEMRKLAEAYGVPQGVISEAFSLFSEAKLNRAFRFSGK